MSSKFRSAAVEFLVRQRSHASWSDENLPADADAVSSHAKQQQ